jgi:hypothetical protein
MQRMAEPAAAEEVLEAQAASGPVGAASQGIGQIVEGGEALRFAV